MVEKCLCMCLECGHKWRRTLSRKTVVMELKCPKCKHVGAVIVEFGK